MSVESAITGPRSILRSLRHRNYRLFFFGQGISVIGTWMQMMALSWLVYRLTRSALLLGLVGFAGQICAFFLAPFAGVLIDRWNRRHVIICTQTLAMVQALVLAGLTLTGVLKIWHIFVLSGFGGLIVSFDIPARQAFVVEMVEDREDLSNAIALNSFLFNGARFIGPPVAGAIVAVVGEGVCFLLNGISYIAVIVALFLMTTPWKPSLPVSSKILVQSLKEGLSYAFHFKPIRSILLFLGSVSLFSTSYGVLMPVFAKDILRGGPETLGLLMGAVGVGAVGGATYLASRKSVVRLESVLPVAGVIFSFSLIAFAFMPVVWGALPLLIVVGFGMMVLMAGCNTVIQSVVDDDKRGRVMSLYAMMFLGTAPFGSLLAGGLADLIGAPFALLFSAGACILTSAVFAKQLPALRDSVLSVYVTKGIAPRPAPAEVRTGGGQL